MITMGAGIAAQKVGSGAPGAPTSFAVVGSPASDGGDFTWVDPVNTGRSALTGYKLYARTPQGSGAYSMIGYPGFGAAPPYTVESLATATPYDLYVTATNSQGESPPSNVIQVTTA